jgi:hypothetical protein
MGFIIGKNDEGRAYVYLNPIQWVNEFFGKVRCVGVGPSSEYLFKDALSALARDLNFTEAQKGSVEDAIWFVYRERLRFEGMEMSTFQSTWGGGFTIWAENEVVGVFYHHNEVVEAWDYLDAPEDFNAIAHLVLKVIRKGWESVQEANDTRQ